MKVLITGGAGFIGTKLQNKLYDSNLDCTIMDNLSPQIHGDQAKFENKFNFKFIKGDILNVDDWIIALEGVDIIVHLAAETGTGQSMYEMEKYIKTNCIGTANMFSALRILKDSACVKRVILSSSRAVYGEGAYKCSKCNLCEIFPLSRSIKQLEQHVWNHRCPQCREFLIPIETKEDSRLNPVSIYASTKLEQEHIVKISCESLGIDYSILRFQNVYGGGQSLKNPYTGLLTVFTNQINNNSDIHIYEDGHETRDFVHVDDVVDAIIMNVLEKDIISDTYNVGSGIPTTIERIAALLVSFHKSNTQLIYSNKFRLGDIRHNYASLEKIYKRFGYKPKVNIEDGLFEFYSWTKSQSIETDNYLKAENELKKYGLMKK